MLYEEREKARRDIASMLGGARKEVPHLAARNAIEMGMDIETENQALQALIISPHYSRMVG